MSKLFNLKEWLTLDEAAQHLSGVFGEPVELKDIYRLALDGHLRLSVNFVNHAYAKIGEIVGLEEVIYREVPEEFIFDKGIDESYIFKESLSIDDENFINMDYEKLVTIDGVWDLMMLGSEALDIEHHYQQLTGGPSVTLTNIKGIFVQRSERVAQIQDTLENNEFEPGTKAREIELEASIVRNKVTPERADELRSKFLDDRIAYLDKRNSRARHYDYYPAGALPSDSVLVVRTKAIMDFLQSLDEHKVVEEKPLILKERHTFLLIIAALCKDAGIDYNKRGIASSIALMTENLGAPVTDDTIRKVLRQIEDAVAARSK